MSVDLFDRSHARTLIPRLAWPTMIGVGSSVLHQLVNTFFVTGLGSESTAAVVLLTPVTLLCVVIAQVLGVGVSSVASRRMGAGDTLGASLVASACLVTGFIGTLLLAVIAALWLPRGLAQLLGAGTDVVRLMTVYGIPTLGAHTLMSICIISGFIVRAEGRTRLSMATQLVAFGMNIALDMVFIWGLHLGVVGAGYAMLAAQACAVGVYVLCFRNRDAGQFRIHLTFPYPRLWRSALAIGFPTGAGLVVNNIVLAWILALATRVSVEVGSSVGVAFRVYAVTTLLATGFVLGSQGVIGYWYGRDNPARLRLTILWIAGYAVGTSLILSLALAAASGVLAQLLHPADASPHILMDALKLLAITVPLVAVGQVAVTVFQSIGRLSQTMVLVLLRSGIVAPLLLQLAGGARGAQDLVISLVVSDVIAGVLGIALLIHFLNSPKPGETGLSTGMSS